jgi:hypothetical protein
MEQLETHDGNGQSYGYLIYRKSLPLKSGKGEKVLLNWCLLFVTTNKRVFFFSFRYLVLLFLAGHLVRYCILLGKKVHF